MYISRESMKSSTMRMRGGVMDACSFSVAARACGANHSARPARLPRTGSEIAAIRKPDCLSLFGARCAAGGRTMVRP